MPNATGVLGSDRPRMSGRRRATLSGIATAVLLGPLSALGAPAPAAAASGPPCATPAPLSATAENSTTGVTPTSVALGNVSIIGGPVPGLFEGAPVGTQAYFDYVNSKGGVYGRKLTLDSYDDGFNGQQNAADTQSAVSKDFALVGSFSLFDSYGCKVLAQNPAVPDVSVTIDPTTNTLANVYSAQPLGQGLPLGPLLFLKKRYPTSLSLGALVSNASTAIAQWQGQEVALRHEGYHITYVRFVNPLETDFTADIVHMRSLGVQTLFMTDLDWQVSAALVQDMTQQVWKPQVVFSGGPAYALQFIKTAGGPAADGVWIGQLQALYQGEDRGSFRPTTPSSPGSKRPTRAGSPTSTPSTGGRRPNCSSRPCGPPARTRPGARYWPPSAASPRSTRAGCWHRPIPPTRCRRRATSW